MANCQRKRIGGIVRFRRGFQRKKRGYHGNNLSLFRVSVSDYRLFDLRRRGLKSKTMNSIKLNNVLPHVFEQVSDLQSDVWKKDICFEKGHLYLVEAASGKGKSTFCSYVIGYRHDYTGQVVFDQKDVRTFNVNDWVNIRQKHISHLFQELRLFPELTAMENVKIKNFPSSKSYNW